MSVWIQLAFDLTKSDGQGSRDGYVFHLELEVDIDRKYVLMESFICFLYPPWSALYCWFPFQPQCELIFWIAQHADCHASTFIFIPKS
jgi:hypothetical protein